MELKVLLPLLKNYQGFKQLVRSLADRKSRLVTVPVYLRSYLLAGLISESKRPFLIITPTVNQAEQLVRDLHCFLRDDRVWYFPDWETLPYESISPSRQTVSRRLEILYYLTQLRQLGVVVAVQTLLHRLTPRKRNLHQPLKLKVGAEVDMDSVTERLVKMGYSRQDYVEERGEFSVRGGLIDIFSPAYDLPLRVEFAYDKVGSIRFFRVADQRSVDSVKQATIFGCREACLDSAVFQRLTSQLQDLARSGGGRASTSQLRLELERLQEFRYFEGVEKYLPLMEPQLETLLDYLPDDGLVVFDEPGQVLSEAERYYDSQQEHLKEQGKFLPSPTSYFLPPEQLARLSKPDSRLRTLDFGELSRAASSVEPRAQLNRGRATNSQQRLDLISLKAPDSQRGAFGLRRAQSSGGQAKPVEPMLGSRERLKQMITRLQKEDYTQVAVLYDQGQVKRLKEIAAEFGFYPQIKEFVLGKLNLATGNFSRGFIWPEMKLALLSYSDIFVTPRPRRWRGEKTVAAERPLSSLAEVKAGDYVVHTRHGIACYKGLAKEKIGDAEWECLVLRYADGILKIRADQMDKVSKYIVGGGVTPKLSFLGRKDWWRTKQRVKASVKKMALDLFKLYLQRAQAQGVAFSLDSPWQRELEESFSYEETSDQLKAISEVKGDMEAARPMDRLVCGDVGYGKTEVAVRAAFKAVMDGKQVFVLAPTTILAQQHWATFKERLAPFPVFVEMLSRFRSPAEQKRIIEALKKGQVDIVIGTHRLLQIDVRSKDLGLIIVDEEQRFGVAAKEHLKNLKKSVDVLTLSATPIPRTLQMSLSGIRDLSIIDTAPEGRFPIMTYVGQYGQQLVRSAIYRELHRGGQIYYVHNQVQTIYQKAKLIEDLVPEARVAVAHGQMPERDLEEVMLSFLDRKWDLLVCTTIIESGIDIPSVNTLIVEEADRLGLAQLYQLRGRVGRSDIRAFAYFFFSPVSLTTAAGQRLRTIGEMTELGSGFKVALRDLEIRGGGNFLGPEQHGYMAAVGFDLYCQLLSQAVSELTGHVVIKPTPARIDIPVRAYLPSSYIDSESLRLEAYSRIVSARSEEETEEVSRELRDRYGALPAEAKNLLSISRVKLLAGEVGATSVSYLRSKVILWPLRLSREEVASLQRTYPGLIYKRQQKSLVVGRVALREVVVFLLKLLSDIISQLSCPEGRRK